jgi:hypothetical protein
MSGKPLTRSCTIEGDRQATRDFFARWTDCREDGSFPIPEIAEPVITGNRGPTLDKEAVKQFLQRLHCVPFSLVVFIFNWIRTLSKSFIQKTNPYANQKKSNRGSFSPVMDQVP